MIISNADLVIYIDRWRCFTTTGDPPQGVIDFAACNIGRTIYFFGGNDSFNAYQNYLYSMTVNEWKWNILFATSESHGPMRKAKCQMVSFNESLLVVGGYGPAPKRQPPSANYQGGWGLGSRDVITDEHHMYALLAGKLVQLWQW